MSILSPPVSLPMVMCCVSAFCFTKLLAATCSLISFSTVFSCEKFTASVSSIPSATPVIFLLPALIPKIVTCGPSLMIKPVLSKVTTPAAAYDEAFSLPDMLSSPNFMLFNVRSFAKSNVTLLSSSPLLMLRLPLPATKSTGLIELTLVLFLPSTKRSQLGFVESCRAFSCATFTASVSAAPAATPTICLVRPFLPSPILNTPNEDNHVLSCLSSFFLVLGS